MKIAAVNTVDKIITVIDDEGYTSKVETRILQPLDKKHRAKPGNAVEINSQADGGTVAIAEKNEEGYVKAKLTVMSHGVSAGTEVQIKALDYTSKSDSENVNIVLPNKKMATVKKSSIKLFEAGVYNSETDIKNNPKTDENKPDEVTAKLDNVLLEIESVIAHLQELKITIDEGSALSSKAIDSCILELTSYKESLKTEKEISNTASPKL